MQRGDVTVSSVTAVLTAVVVAAVAYSVLVLDRGASALVSQSSNSSWLVVTWGPSFCAVQPEDAGCVSGEADRLGQTMLLHGLWPQPEGNQYCGVTQLQAERARKRQSDVPPLEVSDGVRADVQSVMIDSAELAPHEWYAHGTCSGVTPDAYFGDAVALTGAVRDVLDPVFQDAAGGQLTLTAVRERIEQQFGAGLGDRVALGCRNVTGAGAVVVDVRLSLPAVAALRAVDESLDLAALLAAAPPIEVGCRQGHVP